MSKAPHYWLMKSEPDAFSWDMLLEKGQTSWDGVRNYTAANNMKAMALGDLAFFYHSNIGKEIVGMMKVIKTYHPDPSDKTGRFGMVAVAPVKALARAVTLAEIKNTKALSNMVMLKQGRLSVTPVTAAEWQKIIALSEKNQLRKKL